MTHAGRIENAQRDFCFPQRQGQPQMVGPGGFENKLHSARIFFGCLDQLTEACLIIARLRWQSQRGYIEIEFVFGDIDRTVEKIFLHRLKSSNLIWVALVGSSTLSASSKPAQVNCSSSTRKNRRRAD